MMNEISYLKDKKWYLKSEEDLSFLVDHPEVEERQNIVWKSQIDIVLKNLENNFLKIEKLLNDGRIVSDNSSNDLNSILYKFVYDTVIKYKGIIIKNL
jgi:hypothetical protein